MWTCALHLFAFNVLVGTATPVADESDTYKVVNTTFGKLRGRRVTLNIKGVPDIYQFLGIPYAAPPIERRRFSAPESPDKWEQRDAFEYGPACPQSFEITPEMSPRKKRQLENLRPFVMNMSEDCLYLNVFTPSLTPADEKLAVMVFIHDGEFRSGAGSIYNGSILASYGQVVIVTVNFRIGILGFLSSGTDAAKGNYGLQDQIAALQWIQDNIYSFNGDKSRVTVVGAGSGAASSGILALSNRTSGLIHRVIAQGGSPLVSWVISTEPSNYFMQLAEHIGCQNKRDLDIIDELREAPVEELLKAEKQIRAPLYFIAFGPVIDGDIIADKPVNLIRNVQNKISIMTGFTEGDAYELVELETDDAGNIYRKEYEEILQGFVQNNYGQDTNISEVIKEAIHFEYTGWEDGTMSESKSYTDGVLSFISDRQWVVPAVKTLKMFDQANLKGFLYFFSARTKLGLAERWAGSVFLDEVQFVMGAPLLPNGIGVYRYNYTKKEAQISLSVMTYWTNFVKSGNPNLPNSQEAGALHKSFQGKEPYVPGDEWVSYTVANQEYLHIGQRRKAGDFYRLHKLSFWEHYIPKVVSILSGSCYNDVTTALDAMKPTRQIISSTFRTNTVTIAGSTAVQKVASAASNTDNGGPQMSIVIIVGVALLLLNFAFLSAIYYIHHYKKKYQGDIVVNNTYNDAMVTRAMRKNSSLEDERLMTHVAAERLANHSRGNDIVSPTTKIRSEKSEYQMDV